MNPRETTLQLQQNWHAFWKARSRRERSYLTGGALVCLLGATYAILIDPAITQEASLQRSLPALRQEAAQIRQLAQQVKQMPPPASEPMEITRESIDMSLKTLGLVAQQINVSDRTVQLQFASASLVRLLTWLEQAQRQQLSVTETSMQTQTGTDTVKATVTLTRTIEEQQ